jgi:hypothetical protein
MAGMLLSDFTPVFKIPVDITDIPHQKLECPGMIAGDRLSHIYEIGFVTV